MAKIPSIANKVFSGVLYDVYQWEQEMFDGSFETFEMLRRNGGVGMICVTKDHKIIILNEEQPNIGHFVGVPGGCLEDHEVNDLLSVAKRELLEETGYEAKNWEVLTESYGMSKLDMHEITYIARNTSLVSDLKLDAGEKIEVMYTDFESFLNMCRDPKFRCQENLRIYMYECLLDKNKKEEFRKKLFG